jgi:hypothetical protein
MKLRSLFRIASGVSAAALLLAPTVANAGEILDLGAGVMLGAGLNVLPAPTGTGPGAGPTVIEGDTFSGTVLGAGLSLDARLVGIVGAEVDFFRSEDKGSGEPKVGGLGVKVTVGQPSLHVPMLAKVVLPLPLLSPFVVFGPEFVIPGKSEATVSVNGTNAKAYAEGYTMLTGGIGMEIKLPIPALDIRIPMSARLSLNPKSSSELAQRVNVDLTGTATFRSEWKYQGLATLGVAFYY